MTLPLGGQVVIVTTLPPAEVALFLLEYYQTIWGSRRGWYTTYLGFGASGPPG